MKDHYYIPVDGGLVEVSREVWQYHNQNVNHIHYIARKNEECWASQRQMAVCNGDCYTCPCYTPKGISVDALTECNDSRVVVCGYNDPQMLLRCEDMIADMARVDPEYGERIGRMIMDGWQIVDIAAVLGIPASTLRDRLRRIGRMIRGE